MYSPIIRAQSKARNENEPRKKIPQATDIGRSFDPPPSLENAGEGGTNVSSVNAIDTGWYAPDSGGAPEPGSRMDWTDEVGPRGIGVIRPGFLRALAFPDRLRNMYINPATTNSRMTTAFRAMMASIAGRYELSLLMVLATSSETATEPEEEVEGEDVLAAL